MRSRTQFESPSDADELERRSRITPKNLSPMTRFVAIKKQTEGEISGAIAGTKRRPNLIDIVKSRRGKFAAA